VTFRCRRIGVPDLSAEQYLQRDNPLAFGLVALMKPGERHAAEVKADCRFNIARALIDEAHKRRLANCVETYLRLDVSEEGLLERLVQQPAYREVDSMIDVYEIRGGKKLILRLLHRKFGVLPEEVERRIQAIESYAELEALAVTALDARSLADLGLGDDDTHGRSEP
jgi:hypothetical protein